MTTERKLLPTSLKPISTTLTPIKSVDLASKTKTEYERSALVQFRGSSNFESVLAIDLLSFIN